MSALHSIAFLDQSLTPVGSPVGRIPNLQYALVSNGIGECEAELFLDDIPVAIATPTAQVDAFLLVNRAVGVQAERLEQIYLIQEFKTFKQGSNRYTHLWAQDARMLLQFRYVLSSAGTTIKSGPADNVMKAFVREAMTSAAVDTARRIPSTIFAVDADLSAGPSVTVDGTNKTLLDVCVDACAQSAQAGTLLYFQIVYESGLLNFRTSAQRQGILRTDFIFSQDNRTLSNSALVESWKGARTFVYAAAAGQGAGQLFGTAQDTALIGSKPFGRREVWLNASSATTQAAADGEAATSLRKYRPSVTLTANMVNLPGAEYGDAWAFGDEVTTQEQDRTFQSLIDAVSVTRAGAVETVNASVKSSYEV